MAQIKCLYCSAFTKEGEEDCQVCGLPLTMSVPQPPVTEPETPKSAPTPAATAPIVSRQSSSQTRPLSVDSSAKKNDANNDLIKDAYSQFQQKRSELAMEFEQQTQKKESTLTKAVGVLAITVIVAIGAFLFQRQPENAIRTNSDTTPVVLDQSVGIEAEVTPTSTPEPAQVNANFVAAEKAIQANRYDEAERLLQQINANDKDFIKAQELRRTIKDRLKKGKK